MSARTHSLAALLVTGVLLLTGCSSEEPEPKIADEPSATPTVVKEETAEEFIRRWNDEMTAMQRGETKTYRQIAGKCDPCMASADRVDEYYAAGGYVKTEGRRILSVRKSVSLVDVKDLYLIKVESAPTEYKTSADAPSQKYSGGVLLFEVQLSRIDDEWQVIDTIQVPS